MTIPTHHLTHHDSLRNDNPQPAAHATFKEGDPRAAMLATLQACEPSDRIAAIFDNSRDVQDALHGLLPEFDYAEWADMTVREALAQIDEHHRPPVRAILIDPFAREVREIHARGGLWGAQGLLRLLGCRSVDCHDLGRGHSLWFDDEGMLKDWSAQAFTLTPFFPDPMAGRLLILAEAPHPDPTLAQDGETVPVDHALPPEGIERLRQAVQWVGPKAVEVPAPRMAVVGADGMPEVTVFGGDERGMLTYDQH